MTDQEARLIAAARSALIAGGNPLKNTIYRVRRDGQGWMVTVDTISGCPAGDELSGRTSEPSIVVDGTIFVKLNSQERVVEILGMGPQTRPTTAGS